MRKQRDAGSCCPHESQPKERRRSFGAPQILQRHHGPDHDESGLNVFTFLKKVSTGFPAFTRMTRSAASRRADLGKVQPASAPGGGCVAIPSTLERFAPPLRR